MIAIIPDVHGREFWKQITPKEETEKYEKIIFLGDYLDPYGYEGITKQAAIENFAEIIKFANEDTDKVVLLLGNHDLPYIFSLFDTKCRFDNYNARQISLMFQKNINLFKLAYEKEVNGKRYLFSHAGLMKGWMEKYEKLLPSSSVDDINNLLNTSDGIRSLCDISFIRGGYDSFGSIVWSDVYEKTENESDCNIAPYDYQVFGHTQQAKLPIITDKWACLDCRRIFQLDDENKISAI